MRKGGGLMGDSLCPHYSEGLPVQGTRKAGPERGSAINLPLSGPTAAAERRGAGLPFSCTNTRGGDRFREWLGPGNGWDGKAWRLQRRPRPGPAWSGACARAAPWRLLRVDTRERALPPVRRPEGRGRCQMHGCFQAAVRPGFFHFNGRVIKMKDQHFY